MRRAGGSPKFIDQLEDRRLLAIVPLQAGFQLNASSPGSAELSVLASDAKGNYVSVWEQAGPDGSTDSIQAQLYNSKGKAIGKTIQVSLDSTETPVDPVVAMSSKGSFVIAWQTYAEGTNSDIRARRFTVTGASQGGEIIVAAQDGVDCQDPAVGLNSKGQFVVSWTGQDSIGLGVFARQYSSKGVAGKAFKANTFTIGDQAHSAAAVDSKGQAIITWQSANQDGSGQGIFAQRVGSTGKFAGSEFRVNSNRKGNQQLPAVSVNSKGTFMVTWATDRQDGDGYGIVARKFDAKGSAKLGEFQVNTEVGGNQIAPSVTASGKGDFMIAWANLDGEGVVADFSARKYDSAGKAKGGEFDAPKVAGVISPDRVFSLSDSGMLFASQRMYVSPLISIIDYRRLNSILTSSPHTPAPPVGGVLRPASSVTGSGGVTVQVTYAGDFNLDGVVNSLDLNLLASSWSNGGSTISGTATTGSVLTIAKFRLGSLVEDTTGTLYGSITGGGVLDVSGLESTGSGVVLGSNQRLITNGVVESSASGSSDSVLIDIDGTAPDISQSPSPDFQPSIDSVPPLETESTAETPPAPAETTSESPPAPPETISESSPPLPETTPESSLPLSETAPVAEG